MKRFILSVGFAFILFLVTFFVLVTMIELWLLENWFEVESLTGMRQKEWLNHFSDMALYTSLIALAVTFFWHFFGYYFYRIKTWRRAASSRLAWAIIFLVMLIIILIFGWLWTIPTQDEGKLVACGFYLLNAVFIYCLSSWVLSPATVKYAPVGSAIFAPIGNGFMRLLYRS
jgi:hypothetical protein